MVAHRAAHPGAAGICICGALFLAGVAFMAFHRTRRERDCAGTSDSRGRLRARPQERGACDFRALCLLAESAVPWIVVDWHWFCRGGAELVGGRGAGRNVFCDLSSGDPR